MKPITMDDYLEELLTEMPGSFPGEQPFIDMDIQAPLPSGSQPKNRG
jgi:hypothetical protein